MSVGIQFVGGPADGKQLVIDGEDRAPLPGCPQCGTPADNVTWNEYETELTIDVNPCGHTFRTPLPIEVVTRDAAGRITSVTEWHL